MDSRDPRNNYQRRENLSRRRAAPERQEPLRKYVENDNPPVRARQRNSRQHEYENDFGTNIVDGFLTVNYGNVQRSFGGVYHDCFFVG